MSQARIQQRVGGCCTLPPFSTTDTHKNTNSCAPNDWHQTANVGVIHSFLKAYSHDIIFSSLKFSRDISTSFEPPPFGTTNLDDGPHTPILYFSTSWIPPWYQFPFAEKSTIDIEIIFKCPGKFSVIINVFISGKLEDFFIGVTDESPRALSPTPFPPNYKVCSYVEYGLHQDHIAEITCTTPVTGRHVIIQRVQPTALVLCEVGVFTGKYTNQYLPLWYIAVLH